MKHKILFLMLAGMISSQGMAAGAAASKVGYVDIERAIQATTAGKKAKEQLDAEFKRRKDALDKTKSDIDKMGQDLEKKKAVLSEEVLGKKQMDLQEQMVKFQRTVSENQAEMQKKQNELLEPIFVKVSKEIEKVAHDKGFNMVLDKKGQGVLFAEKETDLTDDVVAAFEKDK